MDPFAAAVSLAAVVFTLLNLAKFVRAGIAGQGWNGAITIVAGVLIAWGVLVLFGASTWGAQQVIGDKALTDLDLLDKFVAAVAIAGVGSVIYDTLNAIDGSSTQRKPSLTGDQTPPRQADGR